MARPHTATDHSRPTAALLRAGAVAALAVSLAGCYSPRGHEQFPPNDYRVRHPITLSEAPRTIELFLSQNRGGLKPAQRADVLAFAGNWRHEATSGVVVEVPVRRETKAAARDSLREVHSIFAAAGIPQSKIYMRSYEPEPAALASIKLSYSKVTAHAGPCGAWPSDLGPAFDPAYNENRPYYNLGCASQRNLAAMVDNPADFVQPRGETPAYAARRSVVIDKYRKGENPSGTYDKYDQGKISDLGK